MKNNGLIAFCLFISILILGAFYVNENYNIRDWINNIQKTDTVFNTKTDTLWKDTVVVEKEFVPKYIVKTKIDTVFTKQGDTLELVTESKRFDKTLTIDKDTADVEIYTSGIETSLDSLKMRLKTHNEVVTNTIEVTKYIEKKKTFLDRFHIGVQCGYGYGFKHKGLEPYVGFGFSFDL